jgi:dynein heavy chain
VEENLLEEIELDYSRTMNKIIFDSYMDDFSNMFDISDVVAQKKASGTSIRREARFGPESRGIIEMSSSAGNESGLSLPKSKNYSYTGQYNFDETFKEFCFSSLFIKKEAIEALQEIRVKCINVHEKNLFSYDWDPSEIKRVDEFKTIQESAISQLGNQLKGLWINSMIGLVKKKFGSIGKGWFNMKETNKLTYEYGKLKRFLTVIRLNMQDSVFDLLKRSLRGFVEFFKSRIPMGVTIISENQIQNEYAEESVRQAVLSVDFIQVAGKEEFNYLFKPDKIKNDLLLLFEKAVEELKTIPDLEPKILEGLNKAKKTETFILTPILPKKAPEVPDPTNVPRRYADENKWVWDLREELRCHLEKAVKPLSEFRRSFDKYKGVLGIRPEEFVREISSGENQANLEFIKGQILKWQREERRLKEQIPEEIQVGCFVINCKEVLRILLGKYQEINKKLIEMLARKLKESGSAILRSMQEIEKELYQPPQDIESLSQLKEFVDIELPERLEQLESQTETCVQIYEMLESQSYKLKQAELDNRWKLIGKPREIRLLVGEWGESTN